MKQVILLSVVTASIAFTLSESAAFANLRERINNWSPWLGNLLCCGYCLGHWIAFGLVVIYQHRVFQSWCLLDYFLTALVIAWLAGFQWVLLCWFMKIAGK